MKTIQITIPSSSGNMGCGFDTLGVAVNLYNYFEIKPASSKTTLEVIGGIDPSLQPLCLEMAKAAAKHFFAKSGLSSKHFTLRVDNKIPIARGLASSATFRLAVLEGLNQLLGAEASDREIVQWAAELEGCTDNVAACYYGGVCASGIVNDELFVYRFKVPKNIDFVAVSPNVEVETEKARSIFGQMIPRQDALFNLSRGILLIAAIAQGDFEKIGDLLDDRLHQPQRRVSIPGLKPFFDVVEAAKEEGALGAYLSGSGSTMMAVTLKNKEAVANAMQQAIQVYGMESEVRYLKADNQGIKFSKE